MNEKGKVTVKCAYCGKSKKTYPSGVKEHNFCGNVCHGLWQKGENNISWKGGKIAVFCAQCGQSFERYPSEVKEKNFCDNQCHGLWQSENQRGEKANYWKGGPVTVVCTWCGLPFERGPSEVKEKNFCSNRCNRLWRKGENSNFWKGGITPERDLWSGSDEGQNWTNSIHARIFCELCGKRSVFSFGGWAGSHHALGFANKEFRNDLGAGLLLCHDCHVAVQQGYNWYLYCALNEIHWMESPNPMALREALTDLALKKK